MLLLLDNNGSDWIGATGNGFIAEGPIGKGHFAHCWDDDEQ
jgi:hypothetical protein